MNEHYKEIYEEYAKGDFPLSLLGRHGWMTFTTKEELKVFYEQLSEAY